MSEIKLEAGMRVRCRNGHLDVAAQAPSKFYLESNRRVWLDENGQVYLGEERPLDVVEVLPPEPPPVRHTRKVWININEGQLISGIYAFRNVADLLAGPHRTACIETEISWTPGEGL